jgi:alpha-galactosidase
MKIVFYITAIFIIFVVINESFAQKQSGIALTPSMGWNSWNCFRTEINENKIKEIADAMVSSGMKDAGYEYVIIDDGWMTDQRDREGHIIVDSIKFPNGIKHLADYIHILGLKFGIYSAPGRYTCKKLMGSLGFEQIDACDYAAWGVDFLKYDWCRYPESIQEAKETTEEDCRAAFELMSDCLSKTDRPIIYSVHDKCTNLSEGNALPWIKSVAHMHRTSGDIKNNWDRMLYCLESTAKLWQYAEPGYWNDPDMLEVGNISQEGVWGNISGEKMSLPEYRTHFSMWCMVAAPLIAGNDLTNMKPEIIDILTNKEIIAINQDVLGKQGRRIRDDSDLEVWVKELTGNRHAVVLLNRSDKSANIQVSWDEIGLQKNLKVRDLWKHKDLGKFRNYFTGENIKSHEALVIMVY